MRSPHFEGRRFDSMGFATETPVGGRFQQRKLASLGLTDLLGSFQYLLRVGGLI
jgi:hypothetical protein